MKKLIILLSICFIICCFTSISCAELRNLEFAWNMKSVSDLAGFKMYQREATGTYDYNNPVAVIASPNARSCVLLNVPDDKDLYWVLRAYDTLDNESINSNEVGQLISGAPSRPNSFRYTEQDVADFDPNAVI